MLSLASAARRLLRSKQSAPRRPVTSALRAESLEGREVPATMTATWLFAPDPSMSVTVTSTVSEGSGEHAGELKWNYHVHNNNFAPGPGFGAAALFIRTALPEAADLIDVDDMGNSKGWVPHLGTDAAFGREANDVSWVAPTMSSDDPSYDLLPGEDADFWFYTPLTVTGFWGGEAYEQQYAAACSGEALVPAFWPGFDDYLTPNQQYVTQQPAPTSIDQVTVQLSKVPAAKTLLDSAKNDGVKIAFGKTDSGGMWEPYTNDKKGSITIDPTHENINTLDKAVNVLLFELLRYDLRKQQLDLDNKVMANTISQSDYAVACEKITYQVVKRNAEIAKAAVAAGTWGAASDPFSRDVAPGGDWETEQKYILQCLTPGTGPYAHYVKAREQWYKLRGR